MTIAQTPPRIRPWFWVYNNERKTAFIQLYFEGTETKTNVCEFQRINLPGNS